jgi:SAM-dependent methyltransferase
MNDFINRGDVVVEIGAGTGLSKEFIKRPVIITEIAPYPWVDICVDAVNLPFVSGTIDVIICANVLHHVATPIKFLLDLHRCLKPNGYVLLVEPNPSFLLLLALRMMRHEGWSFEANVFDPTACVNDPADPWSGNNAVSYLMFRDSRAFRDNLPGFEIVHDVFTECMMFPLSGGVTAKTGTVELPISVLKLIGWIDRKLCHLSPMVFAMIRSVVLRKQGV